MTAVVGTVGRDRLLGLVDALPAPTPTLSPRDRILNPESVSLAELDRLRRIGVELDFPRQWTGPGTLCTRSPVGWNDCLDLADPPSGVVALGAYLDESRTLEIWLLDANGDVRAPIQRLGEVDLTAVSTRAGSGSLTVRIRLAGEMRRAVGQAPQVVGLSASLP